VAIPKEKRPVTKHWNLIGLAIFLYYFGSLIYYIIIRATKTLNMGYLGWVPEPRRAGWGGGCGRAAEAAGGCKGAWSSQRRRRRLWGQASAAVGRPSSARRLRRGGGGSRGGGASLAPPVSPSFHPTPHHPTLPSYGLLVLLIEIISSTATIGYAVLLIKYSKSRRTKGLPIAKKGQQPDLDNLMFHVRVLIPCYKESTDLVRTTVLGAVKAPLPRNTLRTVYLCDDGKVRAWAAPRPAAQRRYIGSQGHRCCAARAARGAAAACPPPPPASPRLAPPPPPGPTPPPPS
jgi:hypothetical protein